MTQKAADVTSHVYNDDLLLLEEEQRQARLEFQPVFHALDDPDLRNYFRPIDDRANATKRTAQRAGFWSVIMTVLGLAGAASEPKWHGLAEPWPGAIAIASAVLCVAAVIVLLRGGLHGKRKAQWLLDRLRTERLRQFHFQTFVCRIDEIAQCSISDETKLQAYCHRRRVDWFNSVKMTLEKRSDSKLEALLGPEGRNELWLHNGKRPKPTIPSSFSADALDALFRAYEKFRFQAQADYTNHKLRRHDWSWNFRKMSLRQQGRVLGVLWAGSFILLVALHVFIIIAHLALHLDSDVSGWLHVLAIWLALVALGARTVEHGRAIPREIERYEDYRAVIMELWDRFKHATGDERLEIMVEMEKLTFDEMRNFLRAHQEASFIL